METTLVMWRCRNINNTTVITAIQIKSTILQLAGTTNLARYITLPRFISTQPVKLFHH